MAFATTDQQYYENSEHWGENSYVTLENIIDNIILGADDDSYFKHTKRFRASILGKLCIKNLNVDVKSKRMAISFVVSPSKIFPYPRYMTNWSRVSVLNKCDKLQVLMINNSPQIKDYLTDNEYLLQYDCNGEVQTGDDFNAEEGDCCIELTCTDRIHTECNCGCNDDSFTDSWVKDVQDGSYFEFSEDLVDQEVVIEFSSAGLDSMKDCDIKVHHCMEMTVRRFIEWNLLAGKHNISNQTVELYHDYYKKEKKKTESLLGDKITVNEILQSVTLRYN